MDSSVIANNLHSADHGTDCEESEYLRTDDAHRGYLLSVHVADGVEDVDGVVRTEAGEETRRVAQRIRQRCEISLELCDRAVCCQMKNIDWRSELLTYGGDIF
jgi:hypothetical protein